MTFPFKSITTGQHSFPDDNSAFGETADSSPPKHVDTTTAIVTSVKPHVAATGLDDTAVVARGCKKRFMIIDEKKLAPDEAERLLTKRAYNRECAQRARKRGKDTVRELHRQIEGLQDDKNELRRSLANMEKELKQLQEENHALSLDPTRNHKNINVDIEGFRSENIAALTAMSAPLSQYQHHSIQFPQQFLSPLPQSIDYHTLFLSQHRRK